MRSHLPLFLAALCFPSLSSAQQSTERLEETVFGRMPDGTAVKQFTLHNNNGMIVKILLFM